MNHIATTGQTVPVDQIGGIMAMARSLVASGLTPQAVDTPEKAFYIIMKGRELGVPPIRSLERINIISGRCTMASELMLERFRQRGGHSKWVETTEKQATLWLKAPNADEHTESFSMEDAKAAQLSSKDNWKKWPKAMLRARAISAGLRAMGEAEGLYDPDEMGAVTTEDGLIVETAPAPLAINEVSEVPSEAIDENILDQVDVFDATTGELVSRSPRATGGQIRHIHGLRDKLGHHLHLKKGGKVGQGGEVLEKGSVEELGKYRKKLTEKFSKKHTNELATFEAEWVITWLTKLWEKLDARLDRGNDAAAFEATKEEVGT